MNLKANASCRRPLIAQNPYKLQTHKIQYQKAYHHKQNLHKSILKQNIIIIFNRCSHDLDYIKENIRYGKLSASDTEVYEAAKSAYIHEYIRIHKIVCIPIRPAFG